MSRISELIEDVAFEADRLRSRLEGDEFTQKQVASMATILAKHLSNGSIEDAPRFNGHRLFQLGKPSSKAEVGELQCDRMMYIGDDARFYVEGPRKSMGKIVIDIHPYGAKDAAGWSGVSLREIADLLTTYFI